MLGRPRSQEQATPTTDPPSGGTAPELRHVTAGEADRVTELLALAFYWDPTWGWAFPDPDQRLEHQRRWWGMFVRGALPYEWTWTTADGGAVALWIPPGRPELTEDDEGQVEPLLRRLVGAHADAVLALLERFDAHHPPRPPHYYLSLLATHPDHRGEGKGMRLLAANLEQLDALGYPAYLESSNRANDRRYARLGFVEIDEFSAPDGGPSLACMWRDPR
jgi:GNAT superfamily N-acetyltransferase